MKRRVVFAVVAVASVVVLATGASSCGAEPDQNPSPRTVTIVGNDGSPPPSGTVVTVR